MGVKPSKNQLITIIYVTLRLEFLTQLHADEIAMTLLFYDRFAISNTRDNTNKNVKGLVQRVKKLRFFNKSCWHVF